MPEYARDEIEVLIYAEMDGIMVSIEKRAKSERSDDAKL